MAETTEPTPPQDGTPGPGRRHIVQLVVLGTVVAVIGVILALRVPWFPTQASSQAHQIDTLYRVLLVVSVPIFVLVEAVVLFSVWKFRMRPGEELKDGPPLHGNTRLELVWTALPALLLLSLCTYAALVLRSIERKPARPEMQVTVIGQQFAWSFQYPQRNGKQVSSNQLYLAQGVPVKFNLKSLDVIHAFWVPAFRLQDDAVPGTVTSYRVTPNKLGNFQIICNELCGLGHAVMRSTVHVVTPAAFNAWIRRKGGSEAPGTAAAGGNRATAMAATGKRVFMGDAHCGSCHTLSSAGAHGHLGPNLDRALRDKSSQAIRASIVAPDRNAVPGYPAGVMPPNYASTLSPGELDALAAYLTKVGQSR